MASKVHLLLTCFFSVSTLVFIMMLIQSRSGIGLVGGYSSTWVVLVAGSRGWENYRHQADVLHAYQIFRANGIKHANIITIFYDDIAHNKDNPFPGVVRNYPNGSNLYSGVVGDYVGEAVTLANLEHVLLGSDSAKGKFVNSSPADSIVIYFAGHGGPGFLEFPSETLHRNHLRRMLKSMKMKGKFQDMLIFLEACESGSMFSEDEIFFEEHSILGVTAANSTGASYACCYDQQLKSFTADAVSLSLFGSNNVLDSLRNRVEEQVKYIQRVVNSSQVSVYGDKRLLGEKLFNFYGLNSVGLFEPLELFNLTNSRSIKQSNNS